MEIPDSGAITIPVLTLLCLFVVHVYLNQIDMITDNSINTLQK